jgi:hypothetical protein
MQIGKRLGGEEPEDSGLIELILQRLRLEGLATLAFFLALCCSRQSGLRPAEPWVETTVPSNGRWPHQHLQNPTRILALISSESP